ncbi:MAG: prepilin-type N-terminal cleavage/methylation domain-containing protein [Chthoniobacterales bacterium]
MKCFFLSASPLRQINGFTLLELLAVVALMVVLATLAGSAWSGAAARADRIDALAKIRLMGAAVLQYSADHNSLLPPLFPGQVLEYEGGRGGRIVTECAEYLGISARTGKYLVEPLLPRAYANLRAPADHNAMRVYVMNAAVTNGSAVLSPFGRVITGGQPPVGTSPLAALAGAPAEQLWMLSTADQGQPNVAQAPWKSNTPTQPPLGDVRAVFRFNGSAAWEKVPPP